MSVMAQEVTQEQVLEAARSLDRDEGFTREDVAKKLGVEISAMQPSWKAAKEADQLRKISSQGRQAPLPARLARSSACVVKARPLLQLELVALAIVDTSHGGIGRVLVRGSEPDGETV